MNCSCVYVDLNDADYGTIKRRTTEEPESVILLICGECGGQIQIGEIFRKEKTEYFDRPTMTEITCMDCISIRDTFFCDGWYYGMIHEFLQEHINDLDGEISELSTKKAKNIKKI